MTSKKFLRTLLCGAVCLAPMAAASADIVIPTNKPGGADAEIREEIAKYDQTLPLMFPNLDPAGRRGGQTELASRVASSVAPNLEAPNAAPPLTTPNNRSDRSSLMLIRFNIRGITPAQVAGAAAIDMRVTWHTGNLNQGQETATNHGNGRLEYTYDPPPGGGANFDDDPKADDNGDEETRQIGFNYWVLNPGHPANTPAGKYIEGTGTSPANLSAVAYWNAPGILPDDNIGTIDVDPAQTTFLGNKKLMPELGLQNRLQLGGEFVFSSADYPALATHMVNALAAGDTYVNFIVAIDHDGNANFGQFNNFNYIVNPKEKTVLNNDTAWDADVTNPNNPLGSPHSGVANTGQYSPQLILRNVTPEPTSLALLCLAGLSGLSVLRRQRS